MKTTHPLCTGICCREDDVGIEHGGPEAVELAGLVCEFVLEFGEASLLLVMMLIIGALLDRFSKPGAALLLLLETAVGGSTSMPLPAMSWNKRKAKKKMNQGGKTKMTVFAQHLHFDFALGEETYERTAMWCGVA